MSMAALGSGLPLTSWLTKALVRIEPTARLWLGGVRGHSYRVSVELNEPSAPDRSKLGRGEERSRLQTPGVTFLFGWTGSTFKHLQRYGDFYSKRGEAVIKYCPSPFFIYKLHARQDYERMSKELVELLYERGLNRRPLFFHSFSNGGAYMYYAVCQRLAETGIPIRGSVFDSTPGKSGYYLIKGSVAQVTPGHALLKTALGCLVFAYCEVFLRYKYVVESLRAKDIDKTEDYRYFLHRSLCAQPNLGPQLCLFSKTDDVTLYENVLEFVKCRRKMGVDIEARMWEESRHIKHILDHTEEYSRLVEDFFDKCQNQKNYVSAPRLARSDNVLCSRSKL